MLAMIFVYLQPPLRPLGIYGSIWIIVLAQKTGGCGWRKWRGWNLLFIHAVDPEKQCVEHQKRFASPFRFPPLGK